MQSESPTTSNRVLKIIAGVTIPLFFIMSRIANHGPVLIANDKCFALLGCNIGFFGYDAVLHFISGIVEATLIIWIMRRFPSISLFHENFWKNLVVVTTLSLLVAFSWEFGELCHDEFRMKVLHENLTSPNTLDQPNNNDTMGDTTFSIIGAIITTSLLGSFMKKK